MADAREAKAAEQKEAKIRRIKLEAEQDARIREGMASLREKMEQIRRQEKDGEE